MNEGLSKELLSIRDCYRDDTRALLRYLAETGKEFNQEGLRAYVGYMREQGYKASTINKRLQGAKNRLRLLFNRSGAALSVLDRYEMESALKEVRGVKKNSKAVDLDKTLKLAEVKKLLGSAGVADRVKLFIEFLACTGVRVSEMTGIRLADIRQEHGYQAVRIIGKGTKERILKVSGDLLQRVRKLFKSNTYLFESESHQRYDREYVSHAIHAAGRAVLDRSISAHTLRHTFATIQIQKNRKVKALSVYLGHSTTSITQDMYVHEELDIADLDMGLSPKARKGKSA